MSMKREELCFTYGIGENEFSFSLYTGSSREVYLQQGRVKLEKVNII